MPWSKIVSGGQTGVDRGALDNSFPYGGFCPAGRKAEDGRIADNWPQAHDFAYNLVSEMLRMVNH
jgi:hypothetical protein